MNPKNKNGSFADLYPLIEETIKNGNSFSFRSFGNSMRPLIPNGTHTVTLSPVSSQLKKGDVVFYRRKSGAFVLHRIIKAEKDGTFTLCGDGQGFLEKGIQKDQIIAKLSALEKDGKEISLVSPMAKLYYASLPIRRLCIRFYARARKAFQK